MQPRTTLKSLAVWKCPRCSTYTAPTPAHNALAVRSFTASTRPRAVGPEHPQYIEVPEPPQQTTPYRPPVKGVLPIPRNVFAGTPKDLAADEQIALSTRAPSRLRTPQRGSREEWKAKISELRKQNLREGLKSLRARQQDELRRTRIASDAKKAERQERLLRPEREDERLTAPSNNLDLTALCGKAPPDPNRAERLERKRLNIEATALRKQEQRMDALHSLYMNARDFIVNPQQLDRAIDEAFGTPEDPVTFGVNMGSMVNIKSGSIWAEGKPERIQDMLNRAKGGGRTSTRAADNTGSLADINKQRMRRMAEVLTNGKMDKTTRQ